MAYRRGLAAIGAGLSGFGQGFGDAMLKAALERESRDDIDKQQVKMRTMADSAASEKSDQDSLNKMIEELAKNNPLTAEALTGVTRASGDRTRPLFEDMGKADTAEKLLTEPELLGRARASGVDMNIEPGVQFGRGLFGESLDRNELTNARDTRQAMLDKAASDKDLLTKRGQMQRIDEVLPTGAHSTRFVDPTDTASRYQTALPGSQAGRVTGEQKLGELQTPGLTQAEIDKINRTESGTRGGAVARAGAIAGSEASAKADVEYNPLNVAARVAEAGDKAGAVAQAQADVEYNPKNVASRINEFTQKAAVEAAQAGARENAVEAVKAASAGVSANMALNQLKPLWDKVKLGGGIANDAKRAGRYIGTQTGVMQAVNPDAATLDKQAQEYSMLLYRAMGGTGANVSDKDIQFLQAGIPFSWNMDKVGDKVFTNSAIMLTYNPTVKGRYGVLPFDQQMKIVNTWLDMNEKAKAAGATEFADPFTPGKTVPVIK